MFIYTRFTLLIQPHEHQKADVPLKINLSELYTKARFLVNAKNIVLSRNNVMFSTS